MRLLAWLWLLFAFGSLLAHEHFEDVFGIVGENFTFPVKIDQKLEEIIWTKNKDKVAEWEGQNETTYFTSLRNRGLLNKENGCLTIFNLEKNDAGTYVLDSVKKYNVLTFILDVLDPPSEPEISCNISGDSIVLKCTADFQKPLNYTWKFSSILTTRHTQEVFIPKKNVDASEKAACFIKISQTEKTSEISLTQCFPDNKEDSYHKRSRDGLIAALFLFILAGIVVFLYRVRTKLGTGRAAQKNNPLHGSGEHQLLCSMDNQEQPNSDRDKELNKEDSALKEQQTVNNGVNQEDIFKKENSSLLAKHADDHGVNKGEVTQDAEGANREHLSNSPSCSKEALLNKQTSGPED
ncbi:lymphocyte function-associated antigen 3 isoform X2 [Calonectris borealis]|uniref:lymphocyte function-associated antigen 3 isoform X2 n=1 Tax=Calonectris borealis TaxID=1323832 RepID=UPI003F4C70FD